MDRFFLFSFSFFFFFGILKPFVENRNIFRAKAKTSGGTLEEARNLRCEEKRRKESDLGDLIDTRCAIAARSLSLSLSLLPQKMHLRGAEKKRSVDRGRSGIRGTATWK